MVIRASVVKDLLLGSFPEARQPLRELACQLSVGAVADEEVLACQPSGFFIAVVGVCLSAFRGGGRLC